MHGWGEGRGLLGVVRWCCHSTTPLPLQLYCLAAVSLLYGCTAVPQILRGLYPLYLEAWFKYFDRSQFLILKSEEYYRNPVATFRQAQEHWMCARAGGGGGW